MHHDDSITHLTPASSWLAALPRPRLEGQALLITAIAGVSWLALIGAILSSYILSNSADLGLTSHHPAASYAAYNLQQVAPTSFGTLLVTRADLTTNPDSVQAEVWVTVANTLDTQIDAPRVEDLRVITTTGVAAVPVPGAWSGPSVLIGHSSATIDLTFDASGDPGLLWMEYRDPNGPWPIRVALGSANHSFGTSAINQTGTQAAVAIAPLSLAGGR